MFVLVRACEGLLIANALIAASFALGSAALDWPGSDGEYNKAPSAVMMRVVCVSAAGLAIIGFLLFGLGLMHLLYPGPILAAYCVAFAAFSAINRKNPCTKIYWVQRLCAVRHAWNGSLILTYYGVLMLAIPAVIGNVAGSDPVGYHLVYPKEWANTGAITIDPFLRLPFYATNLLLIFAAFMTFHADAFVNYVTWTPIALAALGMCSSVHSILEERFGRPAASFAALSLTASVIVAASNLRWIPTAYIDAPIGAFALFSLLCMCAAVQSKRRRWLIAAALTAGFLIGMKGSFIVLAPVYACALALSAFYCGARRKVIIAVVAIFIAFASPWYVRNTVLAGDPIPPVLNIAIHGHDGLMTRGEWRLNQADLGTDKSPSAILHLPLVAFARPVSLREYGSTALILWLYVCPATILLLFGLGKRIKGELVVTMMVTFGSFAYWAVTSAWLRYDTVFYFLLPTLVALTLSQVLPDRKVSGALVALLSVLSLIPSPGSRPYYVQTYYRDFKYLPTSYTSDADLALYSDGYADAESAINLYRKFGLHGRVFMVGIRVGYYFYEDGIEAVGDWVGPAGWLRLYRAVDAGRAADFVHALDSRAVMIDTSKVPGGLDVPLERQLSGAGFCRLPLNSPANVLFVAPEKPEAHACDHLVRMLQMATASNEWSM